MQRPYNFYNKWFAVVAAYFVTKYIGHYWFQTEYAIGKQPNCFIPRIVYKIRRQHYTFWEISRVARGLPKTFTYSTWDPKAVSLNMLRNESFTLFKYRL